MTHSAAAAHRRSAAGWLSASVAVLNLLLLAACGGGEEVGPPPAVGTEPGQRAPELDGIVGDGSDFTLPERPDRPTVLVFFRSTSCGLCRLQLQRMEMNLPAYERGGSRVVAVTLDAPERAVANLEGAALGYPVVSVDSAAFERWGTFAGDGAAPLPATYIVDERGIVRYRHIGRNASDRTTDAEVVAFLESLDDG